MPGTHDGRRDKPTSLTSGAFILCRALLVIVLAPAVAAAEPILITSRFVRMTRSDDGRFALVGNGLLVPDGQLGPPTDYSLRVTLPSRLQSGRGSFFLHRGAILGLL